ncbi:right-handed parallel beta-helix repeat-containing protein [Streptomyces sp. NPDC005533]|uniref:right-handed parallel beta-helix repeat-containing protein n=1 Tax=Streptomyces sp. NPDC005533 TaxID=3364723 RepID=UPI003684172C
MRIPTMAAVLLAASAAPLGLVTLAAGTASAAGRIYFVSPSGDDSNAGTSIEAPFRTIQKAADNTEPGDTVSIMNGTYSERSAGSNVLTVNRSGRPGAPITFTAHPGHHPVIHPIKAWNGISVHGSSHIVIQNLEIKGNNAALTLAGAEGGSKEGDPTFNTNCLSVERNRSTGVPSHHIEVTGNNVHGCAGGGISAIDSDHISISGNHVYSNSWYTVYGTSGISVLTPRDVGGADSQTYKIQVTGNRVHDNETKIKWGKCRCYSDGNGIIIDTLKGDADHPAYGGRVLVANNLSYDNGGSGIHSYRSQHVDIVNNTAYLNGRSTRMKSYANIFAHDSTDVRILNNIAYGRPGQATNSKSRNADVTYDFNIYFGSEAPEVKGPNDLIADPKLAHAGTAADADFHLAKGSPAIDSGTVFAAFGNGNGNGAGTGTGAPDRGAYSFGADTTAGEKASASNGNRQSTAPTSGEQPNATTADTAASDSAGDSSDSGQRANGASSPLAQTGGSRPGLQFAIAASVLAVGGGLLLVARRRRS